MKSKKVISAIICILFIGVTLCIALKNQVSYEDDYGVVTDPSDMTQWITITIDGYSVGVDAYAQNVWYDIPQLTTERDMTVTCSEYSDCTVTVNGIPIDSNGTISLRLERLHCNDGIEICVTNPETEFVSRNYIRTLPTGYYNGITLSDGAEAGYYYFNLYNYIYKIDTSGNVVFYRAMDVMDDVPGGFDFKRTEVDGTVYYSYLNTTAPADKPLLSGVNYARAYAVVLDQNYNEIDRVEILTDTDGTVTSLANCQFTILGDHHYLISAYVGKRVYNIPDSVPHSAVGARVVANVIQEIKDGQVVWEWDSTDYPELYAMSVEGNDYYNQDQLWADYAHFDAIAVDPADQNFICSFRNLNAVLKLNRETGEILWVLGGSGDQFGLTEQQLFSRPHDVRVTADGGITLFNNGNVDPQAEDTAATGQSSILKFYLDETGKTVTGFEKYQLENSFSSDYGSAQEISAGHYVVGWGTSQTKNAVFSEIDFNTNRVLFEFCYPDDSMTYRVYKDMY